MSDSQKVNHESAYNQTQATGYARQHNGSIYSNQINHYYGPRTDEKGDVIIKSLTYDGMNARRDAIPDAAHGTFEWILKEDGPLTKWLQAQSTSGVFWLSGMAGAGKSTLMKYIGEDHRATQYLASWAGIRQLIIVQHFFWQPGPPIQKSFEGLLRSLLLQAYESQPHLIYATCTVQRMTITSLPWSVRELWNTLRRLVDRGDIAFVAFIDGLDEYHPQHAHTSFTNDLLDFATSDCVKLIISSRPLEVFSRSFEGIHTSMKLEELTQRDMMHLAARDIMNAIKLASPVGKISKEESERLAQDLVNRSNGVFLWLRLVLGSRCERIVSGGSSLAACLDEYPPELETYIRDMIYSRIHATWTGSSTTARALKLAMINYQTVRTDQPLVLSLWRFYWLLMETTHLDESESVFEMSFERVAPSNVRDTIKSKINAACGGLLVMRHREVDFSHRSVYDFLSSDEMIRTIDCSVPAHFSDIDFPFKLLLARCKIMDYDCFRDLSLIEVALEGLRWTYGRNDKVDSRLLDGFEDAALQINRKLCTQHLAHHFQQLAGGHHARGIESLSSDAIVKVIKSLRGFGRTTFAEEARLQWPQLALSDVSNVQNHRWTLTMSNTQVADLGTS